MATFYASFAVPGDAEKAAGALLDHGALSQDITVLAGGGYDGRLTQAEVEALSAESTAKTGISTTTAGDAVYGAVKGSVIGLGVGTVAALAALAIPGLGLVLGGGALATALAGALGSAAAGAAAGGVAGFLMDQGVGPEYVTRYSDALQAGGSIVAVAVPSGNLDEIEAEQILAKYGATNVSFVGGDRDLTENTQFEVPGSPTPAAVVEVVDGPITRTTLTTTPSTPAAVAAAVNSVEIEPTIVDPVTGAMREGVAIDPLTGFERPVQTVSGAVVYADTPTVIEERIVTPGFSSADVIATVTDPVTGEVLEGYVVDSGVRRNVRVVNGSLIYADSPVRTVVEETVVVQKPPVVDPVREL